MNQWPPSKKSKVLNQNFDREGLIGKHFFKNVKVHVNKQSLWSNVRLQFDIYMLGFHITLHRPCNRLDKYVA